MNTKTLFLSAALAAGSFASIGTAHADISYNVGAVSKYMWRGFDLSDGNMAIQGGLDYEHDNGFYAGAWASQYDFSGVEDGIELDVYLGYGLELNDMFSLDFMATEYTYSGDTDSSTEFKVGLVHEYFEVNYHRDIDLKTDYIEVNSSYSVNDTLSLGAHYGINDDGDDRYYDYALSAAFALGELAELILGYSKHEFNEDDAEGTFFFGVFAYF